MDGAGDAAKELTAGYAPGVLVLDSGLLVAAHDAQWRRLRMRHPGLGAAVRRLIPRASGIQRTDGNTLLVHPDDDEGLRQAEAVARLRGEARRRLREGGGNPGGID